MPIWSRPMLRGMRSGRKHSAAVITTMPMLSSRPQMAALSWPVIHNPTVLVAGTSIWSRLMLRGMRSGRRHSAAVITTMPILPSRPQMAATSWPVIQNPTVLARLMSIWLRPMLRGIQSGRKHSAAVHTIIPSLSSRLQMVAILLPGLHNRILKTGTMPTWSRPMLRGMRSGRRHSAAVVGMRPFLHGRPQMVVTS
ncbi:hypothetical protein ES703_97322 [subsurface metagenome]